MSLSTVFQLSVYSMAAISGLILAIAEGAALPASVTVPLAVLALVFVERRQVFHLSIGWANAAGCLAFVVAAIEFFSGSVEARLLAGAHLLVYLSWIVLLQQKAMRQYWWMCALGVLQVAVASVLMESGLFGTMLAGYVLLSVWTLSVFSLYQAGHQYANAERYAVSQDSPMAMHAVGSLVMAAPVGIGTASPVEPVWSMTRGSIQLDSKERWINSRFVLGVITTALISMMIGMVFFFLIPHIWVGRGLHISGKGPVAGRNITGFSEDVKLGDIGEILESSEPVLEVTLTDEQTGNRVDVFEFAQRLGYEEPLFRGAVLDLYQDGGWKSGISYRNRRNVRKLPAEPHSGPVVRQTIKSHPVGTRILFAIHPIVACQVESTSKRVGIEPITSVMRSPDDLEDSETMHYAAFSPTTLAPERLDSLSAWESESILRYYTQFPHEGLERLRRTAWDVAGIKATGQTTLTPREMVDRLVHYLRDSGEFTYTLDTSVTDSSIDPVEDFLFNRKAGHCEYYASAMALMLRSVGIPSRIVTGFKGGDVNRFNGTLIVQQRHAHAWVEAHLDGKWTTLDPIPEGHQQSVAQMNPSVPTWHDFKQLLVALWSEKVATLSYAQQRTMIYEPLRKMLQQLWVNVRDRVRALIGDSQNWFSSPQNWFSWRGWVVAFVVLWSLMLVWRLAVLLIKRLWHLRRNWRYKHYSGRRRVEFYDRFVKILNRHGFQRKQNQTQREFATNISALLASRLAPQGLAGFPEELVAQFYGVRFGDETLDRQEADLLERSLERFAECLEHAASSP